MREGVGPGIGRLEVNLDVSCVPCSVTREEERSLLRPMRGMRKGESQASHR